MPTDARTVPALLARNRAAVGSKHAVVTVEDSLTHAALDDRSRALAGAFVANGIGKSSRVALMAPNGVEWAIAATAVMRIGGVLVPLSTLLRPPELASSLDVADVTHLLVAREFRGRALLDEVTQVAAARPQVRHVWALDDVPLGSVAADLLDGLEAAVRPADDLVVMFSSGSRGAPKGVVHTHGGALLATACGLSARCIGPDERLYIPMPLFWTGGFNGGLLSVLVAGATLITEAIPEPEATLALLARERVTLFRGWPDQAARLAAHPCFATTDLSCLRDGSLPAVLPPSRRPTPGARANLFGMTETAGPYCGARLDSDLPADKYGSCGRPFDGIEVRIVDPERGGEQPPGVPGEIRLRGPRVMRAIKGRLREATFDVDGFYPTGDLGALDADGYLWFHGRLDDMVKVKGATVYPSEVEAALRAVDGVRQAHVTDVSTPDGSAIAALVVGDRSAADVAADVAQRLSAFKVPTRWLVIGSPDDVPLNASSKVDKPALQERLLRDGTTLPTRPPTPGVTPR
ncbi:MAG TPA: class I adenylate-forming enzyme family protein [Mycobacteriales bacterium]|nr:class I adenylate-forming enzyme family protein [Mycobacteriales bacterium]